MGLAARGARNLDDGVEAVTDEVEKKALQDQAARVRWKSLVFGVLATAFTIFLSVI